MSVDPKERLLSTTIPTEPPAASLREALQDTIGPELAGALEKKGFERLTPVQEAVLSPELAGKDLRISSQTGSGKTVAIGLTLREDLRELAAERSADPDRERAPVRYGGDDRDTKAHPRALVVTPTRELAKQVQEELAWLYAPLGAKVSSVTGGGGYRDELRSFRADPPIIVGTPGRLLDHLKRGTVDASSVGTIVLDEADRMLDLGFREDLLAILGFAPEGRRTHLVSATFPREVKALADRVQTDPVNVEGTPLGTANLDIEHLVHLVEPRERFAAIVNLLLETPNRAPAPEDGAPALPRAQTLIFARTRADVAELAGMLSDAGFAIAMLSGEMEQAERNRALTAFKRGNVDALVATDVAARGIDVQDVARVIHAEMPDDPDAYTHRSGRTGRAGRKGTSSLLATLSGLPRVTSLLHRARVDYKFAPIPTAEAIREARDASLLVELTADFVQGEPIDSRSLAIAERIVGSSEPARAVARLVAIVQKRASVEPLEVTPVAPPTPRAPGAARRSHTAGPGADQGENGFVAFRISWGHAHGAEARRLVAMLCRRGKIEGRNIGAIRVGRTSSVVEVSADVAADFERATIKPDPRDPRIQIRRWLDQPEQGHHERERPERPRDRRPPPHERREAMVEATEEVPKERPSRAAVNDRPSVPKERASRAKIVEVPAERPSRAKIADVTAERPSRAKVADVPAERPSRAKVADVPAERPSRAKVAEVPKERPSRAKAEAPKEPPSRANVIRRPKERPSRESAIDASTERPSREARDDRAGGARNGHPSKPYRPKPGGPPPYSSTPPNPRSHAHGSKPYRPKPGGGSSASSDGSPERERRGPGKPDGHRPSSKPWHGPARGPKSGDRSGPPWRGGDARPKRRKP